MDDPMCGEIYDEGNGVDDIICYLTDGHSGLHRSEMTWINPNA